MHAVDEFVKNTYIYMYTHHSRSEFIKTNGMIVVVSLYLRRLSTTKEFHLEYTVLASNNTAIGITSETVVYVHADNYTYNQAN